VEGPEAEGATGDRDKEKGRTRAHIMVEALSRMPGSAPASFSTVAHFHSTEKHESPPAAATSIETARSDHGTYSNSRGVELWSHIAGGYTTGGRPAYSSNEIENLAGHITDQSSNRILGAHYSSYFPLSNGGGNGSTKTTTITPNSPPAAAAPQGSPFEKLGGTESDNFQSGAQKSSASCKGGPVNVEPRSMYSEAVEAAAAAHLEFRDDDGWNLSSLVNSCKVQSTAGTKSSSCLQAGSFVSGCAEANASAPGAVINVITAAAATCKSSFESGSTGSCSTPSLCVGSPATVTPAPPSFSSVPPAGTLESSLPTGNVVFDISGRGHHAGSMTVNVEAEASGNVESDHSTSIESLMSFGECLESDRDSIVNFVDPNFWLHNEETVMQDCTESVGLRLPPHSAGFLSQFSVEPASLVPKDASLDDTANTSGPAYSAGIYESLEHGIVQWKLPGIVRNARAPTAAATVANEAHLTSDYIHSLLLGGDEMANSTTCMNDKSKLGESSEQHLGRLGAKADGAGTVVVMSAPDSQPCRMRWSDRPWTDETMQVPLTRCEGGIKQLIPRVSPHMASTPQTFSPEGSPTSPLDFHKVSPQLQHLAPSMPHLREVNARGSLTGGADTDCTFLKELMIAVEANSSTRNKRSFEVMQQSSAANSGSAGGVGRLAGFRRPLPQPSPRFGSSSPPVQNGLHMLQEIPATSRPRENSAKFDPAALSALLYGIQQGSKEKQSSQTNSNPSLYALADYSPSSLIGSSIPPKIQRRRHGTATDPQSIAARTRREKFSDRIRILQTLVPNGERLDTVSTLSQTLEYVRFLQRQVWEFYNGTTTTGDISVTSIQPAAAEKWKGIVRDRHSNSQSTIAF